MTTLTTIGKYTAKIVKEGEAYTEYEIWEEDGGDSEAVATGLIRWDGCSNWDMSPHDVQLHFCGTDDLNDLHVIMKACYLHAKTRLDPTGDWSC